MMTAGRSTAGRLDFAEKLTLLRDVLSAFRQNSLLK
jgi:hypothetical protein